MASNKDGKSDKGNHAAGKSTSSGSASKSGGGAKSSGLEAASSTSSTLPDGLEGSMGGSQGNVNDDSYEGRSGKRDGTADRSRSASPSMPGRSGSSGAPHNPSSSGGSSSSSTAPGSGKPRGDGGYGDDTGYTGGSRTAPDE